MTFPVTPPAAPVTGLRGLLDRAWRRRVYYPAADRPYRSSGNIELLAGLRRLIWMFKIMALALVAVMALAFTGHGLPGWFNTALSVVAAIGIFIIVPGSGPATRGLLMWQFQPKHCEALMGAGVPLVWVARMRRSPLTIKQFSAYAHALGEVPAGGVDPRLVWGVTERGVSPEALAAYTLGTAEIASPYEVPAAHWWGSEHRVRPALTTVEDAITIAGAGYTPEQWYDVRTTCPHPTAPQLLRYLHWLRTSHATLHPTQFRGRADTTAPVARTVQEALPVLDAWTDLLGAREWEDQTPCSLRWKSVTKTACAECGGTRRTGHRAVRRAPGNIAAPRAGGAIATVREWVDVTGTLAPHFIRADLDLATASAMCAQPEPPSVEMIATLAALRAP